MVANWLSISRKLALIGLCFFGTLNGQFRTNRIVITPSTDGTDSGIDIPTNANMPNTGAYRIHGAQSKENATIDSYDAMTIFPGLYITHSRGSEASPAVPQSGDRLGILAFGSWDGSAYQRARARISATANGTWTTTSTPVGLTFWTTATGSATPTARWTILESGSLWPHANATYDIGDSITRVASVFGNTYNVYTSLGMQTGSVVTGHLVPSINNTYDLGDGTHSWRYAYLVGGSFSGSLTFSNGASATFSSGSALVGALGSTAAWLGTISSAWIPTANNTYTIGNGSFRWANGYYNLLNTVSVESHLIPSVTNTYELGDSTHNWNKAYIKDGSISGSWQFSTGASLNFSSGSALVVNTGSSLVTGATATVAPGGVTALSATKTIRAAGGASDCNIVFLQGWAMSSTC